MRDTFAALKTYLTSFNLPAYSNETVPDTVELPYITYPINEPEWDQKASFYIQIWDRTTNLTGILSKADEILADIGQGKRIATPEGYLFIWPENPKVQVMREDDVLSAYINLSLNAYHMPGS